MKSNCSFLLFSVFSSLLARFGIVSVPNILVFHQSRAAVKFNQTERTLENFVTFVKNTTGKIYTNLYKFSTACQGTCYSKNNRKLRELRN